MTTATVSIQLEYSINDESFEGILDTAALACNWAEIEVQFRDEDGDDLVAHIVNIVEPDKGEYFFGPQVLEVVIKRILEKEVTVSGIVYTDILSCITGEDELDAIEPDTANVLLQIACYNEVIYG